MQCKNFTIRGNEWKRRGALFYPPPPVKFCIKRSFSRCRFNFLYYLAKGKAQTVQSLRNMRVGRFYRRVCCRYSFIEFCKQVVQIVTVNEYRLFNSFAVCHRAAIPRKKNNTAKYLYKLSNGGIIVLIC